MTCKTSMPGPSSCQISPFCKLEHENLVFIALLSNTEGLRRAGANALARQSLHYSDHDTNYGYIYIINEASEQNVDI